MAIKYTKDQNAYLKQQVTSFRRKIKRLEKKGVSQGLLPSNIKVSDLKRTYSNWEDLEARLEQMRNLTSRGSVRENAKGLIGTDALFEFKQNEIMYAQNALKQRRDTLKQTKKRTPLRTQSLRELSSKIRYLNKNVENMNYLQLQRLNMNALTAEEYSLKSDVFHDNLIDMVIKGSEYSGLDDQSDFEIRDMLKKLSPAQLSEIIETEDVVKDLVFEYDIRADGNWQYDKDLQGDMQTKLNNLKNELPRILSEYGIS